MYIIFDTETTGIPLDYKASAEQVDNWPRIIQLAYMVFDKDRNCTEQFCELIKPDGWEIPKEKFWIDNGYSTENNNVKGIPISEALAKFIEARTNANYSIAHNISFDSKIIRAEMFRLQNKTEFTSQKICTMMKSTKFCQLPGPRGLKFPKLIELHTKLFGVGFEDAHDALADVKATAKCFFELVDRGIIEIDKQLA